MKNNEIPTPVALAALTALILGILVSSIFIHGPKTTTATTVASVPASFPDVKNDVHYNSFLNPSALDPTQVVSVGTSQNNSPFTSQTGQ